MTLCSAGCALTAVASILKYYGADVDPGKLNEWAKVNKQGFDSDGCSTNFAKMANYDPKVTYAGEKTLVWNDFETNLNLLRQELDQCYPVIVQVPPPPGKRLHFVVVTGYKGDTFYINDSYPPYHSKLIAYSNIVHKMFMYRGPVNCCPDISLKPIEQPACLPHDGTGIYYQQQLMAEGGAEPYVFTLTGGKLPAGLTLAPDGKIAGRLDKTQEGSYSIEIMVRDSNDCTTTTSLPITIDLHSCTLEFTNWRIAVNDDIYEDGEFLPSGLDDSAFDWHAGSGTLVYKFQPGIAGSYFVKATFDYLFTSLFPDRFDLDTQIVGTPKDNQLLDINLDEYNLTVDLGWTFTLGSANDYAEITWSFGDLLNDLPYAIFAFTHRFDQSGSCMDTIEYTSDLYITPEPTTLILLSLGLGGLFLYMRKRLRK